jgi:hypothetical protein
VAVEDWSVNPPVSAATLEVLAQMGAEAEHNLEVYRREVGLPEKLR